MGLLATIWQKGGDGAVPLSDEISIEGELLRRALAAPTIACIEKGQDDIIPHPQDGLAVRLSSISFFEDDGVPSIFVDSLIDRQWLSAKRRDDAILVLHEALANAIIHGNFGIEGGNATDPDSFREQGLLITRRLTDPDYGHLPVTLSARLIDQGLEISVQNCGEGFTPNFDLDLHAIAMISPLAKKGRGLGLMQDSSDGIRYEDRGCRLVIFFSRDPL